MSAPIIELKETSFSAQSKSIVQGISLAFEEGTTTALVGPSGGGKSTVLKLAAGLMLPTENDAWYKGKAISTMNRAENLAFRKETAFVFQDSALWANQTLRQILELPLMIHFPKMTQAQRTSRIMEILSEIHYRKTLDIRPSQLSMGEQKLIAFARALVCRPSVLFLDEWTESLDDAAEDRLVGIVQKANKAGATIIFISHDFKVIKNLAQRICMIIDGKVGLIATDEEFSRNESLATMIEKGIAI